MGISRNAPCPCGSGRKHKRCCLREQDQIRRASRLDDEVGRRIQDWSSTRFDVEIGVALEEFAGPERTIDDDDLQLFASWFHDDRELQGGGTPAERYAARADLPEDERAVAARIASARLGLFRVLVVDVGRSLVLQPLEGGPRLRVQSHTVSRDAVRWDILLGRVIDGDPASLWGPVRLFEPSDEPELVGETKRLVASAPATGEPSRALRRHAVELMRFRPSSWDVAPSFFTLEGDPVAEGSATWQMRDARAARQRLRGLGRLGPGDPLEIDITLSREVLVGERPRLPPGAMVIEAGPADNLDSVPIATLRLEARCLHVEAISERRLDRAIEIVDADFGDIAELSERTVVSLEHRITGQHSSTTPVALPHQDPSRAQERQVVGAYMTDRMRRWLDEPHPELDGRTPREAIKDERRGDVIRLVRGIENAAERARRRGDAFADVAWMRSELGIANEQLAA